MLPVAAPVRVRDLLLAAPDGPAPVVHRGRDAVYVEVSGRCVGLLGRHAVAVPCGLRSDLPRVDHLDVDGAGAEVRGGVLHLGGAELRVGRLVDVAAPRLTTDVSCPGPLPSLRVGRGDGLTPYDDDVLGGWLVAHRAAGVATDDIDLMVRALFGRTTLLSATLLDCALHGETVPQLCAYLSRVGTAGEDAAVAALLAVGGSSGRGLLAGARAALDHLRHTERLAA